MKWLIWLRNINHFNFVLPKTPSTDHARGFKAVLINPDDMIRLYALFPMEIVSVNTITGEIVFSIRK